MSSIVFIGADSWAAQAVAACARELGCAALSAATGARALQAFQRRAPDIVVPDIVVMELALPDMDGMALCEQIRAMGDVILIVLAGHPDPAVRIAALDHGADDCLPLPCNPRELLARMQALLRRRRYASAPRPYACGEIEVDPAKRSVTVGAQKVDLRAKEFDLLVELVRRPGRVVTREALLRRVWGYEDATGDDTLDVHVSRLRSRLGDSGRQARFIETIKGVGYRFRESDHQAAITG